MRPDDERYFGKLEAGLEDALTVAREARQRGGDPTDDVEIPIAKDMADRVENILGIDGVAKRVREMEDDPNLSREEAALELATDFAEGSVGDYDTRAGKIEGAVRTAVALLTEGVVAAPIEGIDRVELLENDDGTEFVNIYYAGPIRSAGGTAQALSVLVADYTRTLLGVEKYSARTDEIERYAEELSLYDNETGLQYAPKDKEAKFIAKHLPVMLDGEATGDEEVSGFRDLERVDTNNARGGMCLVLGEGIAQKAPKIQRYTSQLDEVDWPWLQDLIDGTYGEGEADASTAGDGDADGDETVADAVEDDEDDGSDDTDGPIRPEPATKFLRDLIAGRPVFGHPSETGGFRLRYGRSRNHGFATAGVHPATMHLVDDFLATGTQIKTERPGKAGGVIPVDSIEGPTVRLANGDVRRIDDPAEALEIRNGVEAILDLGEYLVNFGEFVENNHPLSPAGYAPEWWKRDMAAAGADVQALEDAPRVNLEHPDAEQALRWTESYDAPLHPEYTYLWHDLDVDRFEALATAVSDGNWAEADGSALDAQRSDADRTLVVPNTDPVREALEVLLVEHRQGDETLTIPDAVPFVRSLGLTDGLERAWTELSAAAQAWDDGNSAIKAVNEVAPFEIRERAPTRIGCRMGRPEKSEKRDLSPAVHTLFPIGETGGPQRNVADAAKHADTMQDTPGEFEAQVGRRRCPECSGSTFRARCPECNAVTEPHYLCHNCDIDIELDESGRAVCPNCEREADAIQRTTIDVNAEYRSALASVGERENAFDVLKGVQGLASKHKVPEPIEKGILRAKNGVSSFKDGTVRYDMTDLPVTSVRAAELDVSVGQLKSLGYETDIHGQPLTHEEQLVELRVQDVVLSDGAAEHMLRTADFVDDLLEQYYGLDRYYDLDDRDDLVGELVFGMAPHTSAAVVGRVIGFTSAAVGYAHPYFHAAKRRNCDGDEDCVMLLMDGILNFSKTFLPDQRGGKMDAPLVMSSRIDPAEIDDEAHNMDIVSEYPREFYEATRRMADPGEVEELIKLGEDTLGTDEQYRGFEHTHDTTNIAAGPDLSAYKTLGDMMEKMNAQLELSRKLRSVDETDVAERVIEYHFLPDIIGNLRAFSRQETRCLDCGEKFRRVPLTGDCRECGGRVNLTVHEGSVKKYIDTAIQVAEEYGCREYTKQRLQILDRAVESVFEDDTNKQSGIADFM
ncbi:MAG: DNA polymerase II large subunit [Natronomonas sp.]|uniref:DNA polymerase II large subunit n=1 Tax=Natronomonas sp. TaxID=2184060 RepID=UPI0028709B8C|nr:DNA polymerase II large subunit [Natronomonas sp.]MDR9429200.1 DNA polymerase II large subunit [Natronomonas sp.]